MSQTPVSHPPPAPAENITAIDHFERSYRKSRERLLTSIHSISKTHSVLIDSRAIPEPGPDGETLATDFVIIGARKPRRALVISSGTHGVEGFAGSAIQHDFLENRIAGLSLPADTAIIIIHANNPFGFAWLRRVSANNIDINRNFMTSFDSNQVSADYQALFNVLNPTDLNPEPEALRWAELERFMETNGVARTQKAITEGQYHYPKGMQFGGQQHDPCVTNLLSLVGEHLASAEQVLWIDIHTGLGEFGACEMISGLPADHQNFKTASQVWPETVSAASGDSLSSPLHGILDLGMSRAVPPDCEFGMVFPEFGTYPVDRVVRAMRADNWLHQHGPEDVLLDPAARAVKAELLEAFRPDNPQWRSAVQIKGRQFIEQGLTALAISNG
ncbi:MAG: DUF2817 domain-containing protein [Burkholderiaceae bacterium]